MTVNQLDEEFCIFTWEDDGYEFSCKLTPQCIFDGHFDGGFFICEDSEGERTIIECFKLEKMEGYK